MGTGEPSPLSCHVRSGGPCHFSDQPWFWCASTYGKATDGWREAAGLRPLAVLESKAKAKNTRRQQFGLYARASAVDDIAGHATRLGLSISQYVSELLTLELRDGQ